APFPAIVDGRGGEPGGRGDASDDQEGYAGRRHRSEGLAERLVEVLAEGIAHGSAPVLLARGSGGPYRASSSLVRMADHGMSGSTWLSAVRATLPAMLSTIARVRCARAVTSAVMNAGRKIVRNSRPLASSVRPSGPSAVSSSSSVRMASDRGV